MSLEVNTNDLRKSPPIASGGAASIRLKICNLLLITVAVVSIPALAFTLYRAATISLQPVMVLQVLIGTMVWIVTFFRKEISPAKQGAFITSIFFIVGLTGIYQFGLLSGATGFVVVTGPVAVLLFGIRTGIMVLSLSALGVCTIAALFVSGLISYPFDTGQYPLAFSSWAVSIIGWLIPSVGLTIALGVFSDDVLNTLATSGVGETNSGDDAQSLSELLPICVSCKSIRDETGHWGQIETYLRHHAAIDVYYEMCPACERDTDDEAVADGSS